MHCRTIAMIALPTAFTLAACGAPPDEAGTTVAIEPASTVTSTIRETSPTLTASPPAPELQLCDDVPIIATEVIGDDPTGGEFNPVFQGVLLTYTQEHASTFGGMWRDREANGTIVLAFTDDPVAHREALALRRPSPDDVHPMEPMPPITDDRPIGEWGVGFDVVQVEYTEDELVKGTGAILDAVLELGLPMDGAGSDTMRNRVSLFPSIALTAEEVAAIAAAVEGVAPLEMACLEGAIVDSRPDPIAPGTPLDVIVLPDPDGSYPAVTEVECGGVQFTLGDLQTLTPIAQADPGLAAVVDEWVNGLDSNGWPADGWVVLTEMDELATVVRFAAGAMYVIGAEQGRNGWIWAGSSGGGPCDVARRLPSGMGAVKWELDASFPAPDATSTEIHVLATERGCTGGSELGERLLGPQIVETDDQVRIVFAAIPLVGAQNCPGNPPTPVTIALAQPLGTRTLMDGLVIGPLSDLVTAMP